MAALETIINDYTDDALTVARCHCFQDQKMVSKVEVWNPFVSKIKIGFTTLQIEIQNAAWGVYPYTYF